MNLTFGEEIQKIKEEIPQKINSSQVGHFSDPAAILSDPQWVWLFRHRWSRGAHNRKKTFDAVWCCKHLKKLSMNSIRTLAQSPSFVRQFLFSSQDNIVLLSGIAFALARARNQKYFKYGNISRQKIGLHPNSKCVQTSFQVWLATYWSDIQGVLHKDRYVRVN